MREPLAEFARHRRERQTRPLNPTQSGGNRAALSTQEKAMLKHAMLKHDSENPAAPEVLTEEQLDAIAGGLYAGPPSEIPGEPNPWQPHAIPGTYF